MTPLPRPQSPTATLTAAECDRIRALVLSVGEGEARSRLGSLNVATFYKAVAGFPVSRLTAQVLRRNLETLATDR